MALSALRQKRVSVVIKQNFLNTFFNVQTCARLIRFAPKQTSCHVWIATLLFDFPEALSHHVDLLLFSDKKSTANDIFVYTVNKVESQKNRLKVIKLSVAELWSQGYKIRINNINDKHKKPNADKEIKNQITYAMKHKTLFHNSLHFVGEFD